MNYNRPNYQKLYTDMIHDKYPEKIQLCNKFLKKKEWIAIDVIRINDILFGHHKENDNREIGNKHRAYDMESILEILRYQYENQLCNNEVARLYGLSRNTISKWKKVFEKEIEQF